MEKLCAQSAFVKGYKDAHMVVLRYEAGPVGFSGDLQ